MPPKKEKDAGKDEMEGKYNAILGKLDALTQEKLENDSKLSQILTQTTELKGKLGTLSEDVAELKNSIAYISTSVENLEKDVEVKLDKLEFLEFKKQILDKTDDLENRSRRNNLVFWNVPEGEEMDRPMGCIGLIQDILILHMKLIGAEEIILEQAHRSGQIRHGKNGDASPRPIHVKYLNWMDKEYVLKRAPKLLKNNPYGRQQATLIITDNVTKIVHEQRKILKTQYLPKILEKPDVKVGFIPHVVPAQTQYKEGDRWKFFYLPDE